MAGRLSPEDEGKLLVTRSGDIVGVVDTIDEGTAYVRPNPGLLSGYGSWLAGPVQECSPFRLDDSAVAAIDSDRVVIGRDAARQSRLQDIN